MRSMGDTPDLLLYRHALEVKLLHSVYHIPGEQTSTKEVKLPQSSLTYWNAEALFILMMNQVDT